MKYIKRDEGNKLSFNLDSTNYNLFFDKIAKLGKEFEYKSDVNKLDYTIAINSLKVPSMNCKGWTSRCEDGKHVFFSDWDNVLYWVLKLQLEYKIQRNNLPPFYIFSTEEKKDCNGDMFGNYLAVNLAKFPFMKISEMQDELAMDDMHKRIPLLYRFHSWVLRTGPKGLKGRPQFIGIIGDITKEYYQEISSAHLRKLKELYPEIPNIKYKYKDKSKGLWTVNYKTASS